MKICHGICFFVTIVIRFCDNIILPKMSAIFFNMQELKLTPGHLPNVNTICCWWKISPELIAQARTDFLKALYDLMCKKTSITWNPFSLVQLLTFYDTGGQTVMEQTG